MVEKTSGSDAGSLPEEQPGGESPLIEAARRQAFGREDSHTEWLPGHARRSLPPGAPQWIGRYRIRRCVSSGGMGTVYEAEQEAPRRTVAVKVIHAAAVSPQALRRFKQETLVLARLRHPGIAQIFEAGMIDSAAGPQPYFSMEFVAGERLTRYADLEGLGLRQRLELVARICDAVQHAHLKGVIHRDLKPANILVDRTGQPKVLDFGVARATDMDTTTVTAPSRCGQLVGTMPYMSPEQAAGDPEDIDTRSDVYSLGVVCYELLAGELPFSVRAKSIPEMLRAIAEQQPARLGTLDRSFRGDVETIVAKAMEKDRWGRYQSAADFAADIRRYLNGEPIQARRIGRLGRLWRWCRREPRVAALLAVALMLLVLLAVGATAAALRIASARRAERQAQRRTQQVSQQRRHTLYAAQMNLAMQAFRRNDFSSVLALLEAQHPAPGEEDLRGFEWYYLWKQLHSDLKTLRGHQGPVEAVAVSPGGQRLASCGTDGSVFLWQTTSWKRRALVARHADAVHAVAFSPDGATLAACGEDRFVHLWDAKTARKLKSLEGHRAPVQCVAFGPRGHLLASGGGVINPLLPRMADEPGEIKIWDLSTGQELFPLPELSSPVAQVAFSPDGAKLFAATWGGAAVGWEIPSGEPIKTLPEKIDALMTLALSPDGSHLALGGWSDQVQIWDLAEERVRASVRDRSVGAVAFSPDGKILATANRNDACLRLWDARTGRDLDVLRGHIGAVNSITFDPLKGRLVSGSSDGTLKIWELNRRYRPLRLRGHEAEIAGLAFSPDGTRIATGGRDGTARIWDRRTGQQLARFGRGSPWVESVVFFPDGKRLAFTQHAKVQVIDLRSRSGTVLGGYPGIVHVVAISPDGHFLAVGGTKTLYPEGRVLKVLATGTWQVHWAHHIKDWTVIALAFSPDGCLLAVGGTDGTVRLFDAATGKQQRMLKHVGWIRAVAFSPDGTFLAAGSWPKDQLQDRPVEVKVWQTSTGRPRFTLHGHHEVASAVAFSPGGKILATGGGGGIVKLWDLATGEVRATLEMPQIGWVLGLAFSPDGRTLACTSATSTDAGEVLLFEAASEKEVVDHAGRLRQ